MPSSCRYMVIGLVMASILGTFIWDRLVIMIFANHIFMAMLKSAFQTTLSDLMPIFMSVVRRMLLSCAALAAAATAMLAYW